MSSSTLVRFGFKPRTASHTRCAEAFRFFIGVSISAVSISCARQPPGRAPSAAAGHSGEPGQSSVANRGWEQNPSAALARVTKNPTDVNLRLLLANEYFTIGETYAGIEQLEAARALGDADSSLLAVLASHYDAVGEPELAAEVLASAKGSPGLALSLSELYLKLGDFQRSSVALRPLLGHWTTLPTKTQYAIVRAALLAGDIETAANLLPRRPVDSELQSLAGLCALIANKPAAAVANLRQALMLSQRDAWSGYLLGRAWLAVGDSKRALAIWSEVAQWQDAPPRTVISAADLLAQSGRLDEADAQLDHVQGDDRKLPAYWRAAARIAELRKHTGIAMVSLGYAAYNEGDPWRAEAIWQRALPQASPELARETYAALSNSATRRQDGLTALRFGALAARRWPQDPECLRQYAETLLAQNQLQDALATAQHFQSVAPPERQAQAAELLERIALDSNQRDLLQQNAQRNRTFAPTDVMPLLHLAEWQGQQGHDTSNLERTLALYQIAQSLSPTNAEATARAGLILADLKRNSQAISTLLHSLTLNPRVLDGAPNALLAQLYARQGSLYESRYEARQYERVHAFKEAWPSLLKSMRQTNPTPSDADWKALGEMALQRHENWISLCAFTRRARLKPADPLAYQELAMTQKRFGWFDEALASMRRAHLLSLHEAPAR